MFQQNPVIYLTTKLWKYSQGNRGHVALYISCFVMANAIWFLEPLVVARMLNTIQEYGVTQASLPMLFSSLAMLFGINLGFWAFHGPARVLENKNAFLACANYKKYLLDGVMDLPMEWHVNHHSGDTIDKIEKGTQALFHYSGGTFQVIESVVRLISSYLVLFYFNVHAGYIVLVMITITLCMIFQFDRVLVGQYKMINHAQNKISEKIFDAISNITTLIVLRIEKLVSSSVYEYIMAPFALFSKNKKIGETKWFLVSICSSTMVALVLGSYLYMGMKTGSVILVGTVYALYGYVGRISQIFYGFAYMYGNIIQQKAAVMNAEEVASAFRDKNAVESVPLNGNWRTITIDSLIFSYHTDEGADLHLDNISLTLTRGERVALIGESGSGKTTFLKVIRDLYHPSSVRVSLDGHQLKDGFKSISEDIALIPQDPEIFSTTILENITVGVNHSPHVIQKVTDMARFTDVAERLPKKLNSFIFEKGVNLSGGEKQRLALARGLLACVDKAIVLLDEPTSSVDTKNELEIYRHIFNEFQGKTILASIHRLHLLSLFDTIYYFQAGKIIASGTLNELLTTSEEFRHLWEKYHEVGKASGSDKS